MASAEPVLYISNEDLDALSQNMSAISTDFLFWGIYTSLVFVAIYLLVSQGVRNSRGRQIQLFIVLLMFCVTSSKAICDMLYYQSQFVLVSEAFANGEVDTDKLINYWIGLNIAGSILQRIDFVLSDGIVVWRAWVLWPERRLVRIILAICMTGTFLGVVIEIVFGVLTLYDRDFGTFFFGYFLVVPMLLTNVVATSTVGIKAWLYRKEVRAVSTRKSKSSLVEKILIVCTESGILYCLIWIVFWVNRRYPNVDTLRFVIIDYMVPVLSAIYPTLIIIIVSLDKSTQDGAVYTTQQPVNTNRPRQSNVEFSAFQAAPRQTDSSGSQYDTSGEKLVGV